MLKAFLKDSAIYAIPTFLSRGISFVLIPFYTRVLTPMDYGSMDLFAAFTSLINLTIALEVSQGVARYYAADGDSEDKVDYFSSALWFTLFCYSIFAIAAYIFTDKLSPQIMGKAGLENSFRIGLITLWIGGIFYLIQNQFRWELRSKTFAISSIVVLIVTFGVSFILTYFLEFGLNGMLIGQAVGNMAGVIFSLINLKNSIRLKINLTKLKEMLVFSAPLVPSGIAVFISTYIDRLMIKHFLTVSEVGLFGMGFRLASVVALVMAGFQGAITPLIYSNYMKPETPPQLAKIFRIFLLFGLLFFLGLTLFAKNILMLITTPDYYAASTVVGFLVLATLLSQMYIFAPGIAISKKTHYFLWINLGGAILNTSLNYFFIPIFGIMGAALATFINYIGVFSAYMVLSQKLYYVPHSWKKIIISILAAISVAVLDHMLKLEGIAAIAVKLACLLFATLVFLTCGLIELKEIRSLYAKMKLMLIKDN